jgi:NAD(P)-dependent dehydrogenase (short-subunit alcohol dehydrogenase family)
MLLKDRVAVITGGGSGIGRAIALRFAAEGARVVVAGQTEAKLEETVALVREGGGEAAAVRCDIADVGQVKDLVRATVERYGRLDILVNNAAKNRGEPIPETVAEMPEDWWAANLDVNLTGHYYCSKYALQRMLEQGGGVIVNVASTNGLTGNWNQAAYIAAKHGMVGLTKSMALDYARKGIRVNAVCPGFTETERANRHMAMNRPPGAKERALETIPLGRIGLPEEVAAAALFLASDESSYITGVALPVDGGNAARR